MNQKDKLLEKEFITKAENGDLEGLENLFETTKPISKTIINQGLISLCRNYKTFGHYENCLNLLLRKKADINSKSKNNGQTPLMICAWRGCSDLVRALLERGARINIKDNHNKSALFYAVESDHGENTNIVSMFLENSSEVNYINKNKVSKESLPYF